MGVRVRWGGGGGRGMEGCVDVSECNEKQQFMMKREEGEGGVGG